MPESVRQYYKEQVTRPFAHSNYLKFDEVEGEDNEDDKHHDEQWKNRKLAGIDQPVQ